VEAALQKAVVLLRWTELVLVVMLLMMVMGRMVVRGEGGQPEELGQGVGEEGQLAPEWVGRADAAAC
jgi:hypothetical protein